MITLTSSCELIAKSLRDFGYPDVNASMVEEVVRAWNRREPGDKTPLPHGVIGMFVERQIDEVEEVRPNTFSRLIVASDKPTKPRANRR